MSHSGFVSLLERMISTTPWLATRSAACGVAMLAVIAAAPARAHSQDRGISAAAVTEALKAGNFGQVLSLAEQPCGTLLKSAADTKLSVAERADTARAALACARLAAAQVILAAPSDKAFQAHDLMEAWIEPIAYRAKVAEAESDFMGLKWGLGFGFSRSSDGSVDDAEIVNDTVRAKSDRRDQPRAVLEFHKYIGCNEEGKTVTRGCGPFMAVAASDDKVVSGVALGVMFGVRARAADSDGFSVGIGAILDGNVRDLDTGFAVDSPPPAGETQVRFRSRSRWGLLLIATRTF